MTNNKIKVSIIVPVYNVEKYLPECLDSLVNQTYNNIEIICINDGSPDNSLDILENYAEKDNRIKIISQQNQGVATARNNGISASTGDYIFVMDSDDFINTSFIESALNTAIVDDSDLVIVSKNIVNISKKVLTPWELFIKKSLLDKYPDIRFPKGMKRGDDTFFVHRLLCLTDKISENSEALYFYRKVATSITKGPNQEKLVYNMQLQYLELLDEFYKKYDIHKTSKKYMINNIVYHIFIFHYCCFLKNKEHKEIIFNKTHDFMKKYNINQFGTDCGTIFDIFLANRFLKSRSWQDFEKYFILRRIYSILTKPFHKKAYNA